MELDYGLIGRRIARRRNHLKLTQAEVAERADLSNQYLSNIERATSIPSTEVIMRLALALDTTPDEFLVGTARPQGEEWKQVAERLRGMSPGQLDLAASFLDWLETREL